MSGNSRSINAELRAELIKQQAEQIKEFRHGFGKITFVGGLLTCAQVSARKTYTFNPTILQEEEEDFKAYLEILKKEPGPLRERFVIYGRFHWMCGDISIDEYGRAQIVFIDSLGYSLGYAYFSEKFQEFSNCFPTGVIYFSAEKRQNSARGCSVFALDDVTHLFTLEQYLDKKYKSTGLFGYLADHIIKQDAQLSASPVLPCQLPLSLERTKQSSKFFQAISGREPMEQAQHVNKRGQNAELSAKEHFNLKNEKLINDRLADKLQKMADHNASYLVNTQPEVISETKRQFTLEGFKNRIESARVTDQSSRQLRKGS
jgi:hypothetical protein